MNLMKMKKLFLIATILLAAVSCRERLDLSHGEIDGIITDGVENVTATSAKMNGRLTVLDPPSEEVGFVYDKKGKIKTSSSPRVDCGPGAEKFWGTASDLEPDTDYEYQAYRKTAGKEYFGSKQTFRTTAISVTGITLNKAKLTLQMGETESEKLIATVAPTDATDKSVTWTSSKPEIATVGDDGTVRAKKAGETVVTAKTVNGKTATCQVTVAPAGAVDLGLPSGRLWRNCNLGAAQPYQIGNYYAWAATESKSPFTEANCPYYSYDSSKGEYYPYKYTAEHGHKGRASDGYRILLPADDAATVKLGSPWRIPYASDIDELLNNCTITTETLNGVKGRRYTGKNGKSIFLPYTNGWKNGTTMEVVDAGYDDGHYWLNGNYFNQVGSQYDYRYAQSFSMQFGSGRGITSSNSRHCGLCIRPVCP